MNWKKLRKIPGKIRKIIAWLPLLWEDEDWDYSFLLKIMRFKIARMGECINGNEIIADHTKVYLETVKACDMLDTFLEKTYGEKIAPIEETFNYIGQHVRGWWD